MGHNTTKDNKRFDKRISDKQISLISSLIPDFAMSILYSVIARRTTVLARFASCIGNFSEITEVVLAKIWDSDSRPKGDTKATLKSDSYLYHYMIAGDLVYLCITEDADVTQRAAAFGYLDTIRQRFESAYGSSVAANVIPFAMNTDFSIVMAVETKRSNGVVAAANGSAGGSASEDKIERMKDAVEEVKQVMVSNIESIVERGERLDLIVDKAENLSNEAVTFRQSGRRLQRRMWWQNAKMKVAIGVAIIVVIYVIVSSACGGMLWPKCVGS